MVAAMNVSDQVAQLFPPYHFELFQDMRPFLEEYWATSIPIAFIYLLLIFVGQNYMKSRKGFNLQGPLILWSFCLAIFSILGAVRTWGYMGTVILTSSLKQTVCYSNLVSNPVIKFWSCLFLLSKIIELGDTAFIILRKRPLIFVHWYHHSTVLVYTSFGYKNKVAAGGWFMTMNYSVHAIMYIYYTLRAAKMKAPTWLPILITSLQILQMFMGAGISFFTYIWRQEQGCQTKTEQFFWSLVLYITYCILFVHYFHHSYIIPKAKAKTKSQ
ncbi:elongation of very long chain fatty acids protein 3 [Suricata suricatta]|uniref:Elongation of very long chain fatty acids protein 3 n=1 Tax=Suricata suricatta TaxID=37032 RepID=A0A673SWS3_SURSU|nr:elongation of very long chain fatty acids protein 3 [Suricata suricatta]